MGDWRARVHDEDVRALIETLLPGIRDALGEQLVGAYLHGSLATGGFDPQSSDVDYMVATREALTDGEIEQLARMHAAMAVSDLRWATNVEGSYIPLEALRRHDPDDCLFPVVRSDGSFGIDGHGAEWIIQRYVIRRYGVVLSGPPPETLIEPISPDILRQAARQTLREWWAPQLFDSHRIEDDHYQAYAVQTMCRARYTVIQGDVVPKPEAVQWCLGRVDGRWHGLIERALAWRMGDRMDAFQETLAFMRETLEALDILDG